MLPHNPPASGFGLSACLQLSRSSTTSCGCTHPPILIRYLSPAFLAFQWMVPCCFACRTLIAQIEIASSHTSAFLTSPRHSFLFLFVANLHITQRIHFNWTPRVAELSTEDSSFSIWIYPTSITSTSYKHVWTGWGGRQRYGVSLSSLIRVILYILVNWVSSCNIEKLVMECTLNTLLAQRLQRWGSELNVAKSLVEASHSILLVLVSETKNAMEVSYNSPHYSVVLQSILSLNFLLHSIETFHLT